MDGTIDLMSPGYTKAAFFLGRISPWRTSAMKRITLTLIATSMLMAAPSVGSAKNLSMTGLEEAFIDAVGTCGPTSSFADTLGKSKDPQVRIALRDALIAEAA